MAIETNLVYIRNLKRLTWLDLVEHIDQLYNKLEVYQNRGEEKHIERMLNCLHHAEEEQESRLTEG